MTDEEIVEAFTAKHGITIMPGPFREQHADLARMGREAERKQTVAWLRGLPVPITADVASMLEAGAHLKPTT
jgi:hypothetical protein